MEQLRKRIAKVKEINRELDEIIKDCYESGIVNKERYEAMLVITRISGEFAELAAQRENEKELALRN